MAERTLERRAGAAVSGYMRVLPRDLFNEAALLKCLGRLWILLDETHGHEAEFATEEVDSFEIEQDASSGAIYAANVAVRVCGRGIHLTRPLNARNSWALYAENLDTHEDISVFDDDGNLSPDMRRFIGLAPEVAPAVSAGRKFYELAATDVNKATIRAFGRTWQVSGFIGHVMPQDVGKRVYLVRGDILQVENDEQRAQRLSR